MAGRGDPQRDHPEALPVRGQRRDHRGDDHLHSRGTGQRAQLGLPLLLAARCRVRGACAEPPGRDAHDGTVPRLHLQPGHHRRYAAAAVRHRLRGQT
ncbi:hypothetical protein G6F63_015289 [Rhizopus arrhizus]|nr:hypothetical protein G6F24_018013 [Rhizopus arrhizus]KAG0924445.1 hypothetical protein G6F31_019111 [Rhizopus arrhizus]KAG1318274.1 hypothetical protein G6F63_015289 [Rhizopus arrhizus]